MTPRLALLIASLSTVASCTPRGAATPDSAGPVGTGSAVTSSGPPTAPASATSSAPAPPLTSAPATTSAQPSAPPTASASASVSPHHTGALPRAFSALGQPCRAGAPVSEWCGLDAHVAGITVLVDHAPRVPPGSAQTIHEHSQVQGPNQRELKIAIDGQRLWIRAVTCGGCRRIQGWTFLGDLARLSDTQLSSLQERVGLPASEKPLRTAAEWRRALAASPPR